MTTITHSDKYRFWTKVDRAGIQGECWLWNSSVDARGYGRIEHGGVSKYAHRFAWLIIFGQIPENMEVCHRCDNPPCVNPEHLFVGTHKENMDDRDRKGRGKGRKAKEEDVSESGFVVKLTDFQLKEIRRASRWAHCQRRKKRNETFSEVE